MRESRRENFDMQQRDNFAFIYALIHAANIMPQAASLKANHRLDLIHFLYQMTQKRHKYLLLFTVQVQSIPPCPR